MDKRLVLHSVTSRKINILLLDIYTTLFYVRRSTILFLVKEFQLSEFLRRRLMIFIIKGFRSIVFIFIVISTMLRLICPPAFFRCLSNSVANTELRTTSFIESMGIACSDSVYHNRVQVLSNPILLLSCSQDWNYKLQMIVSLEA